MLARRFSRRMPAASSERSAATVVSRSSTSSTASLDALRSSSASSRAALASGPNEPSMRRGRPTTILVASRSRATSASRSARVALGSAGIVARGCAMVPVGSLTARPTRFDPRSTASTLTKTALVRGRGRRAWRALRRGLGGRRVGLDHVVELDAPVQQRHDRQRLRRLFHRHRADGQSAEVEASLLHGPAHDLGANLRLVELRRHVRGRTADENEITALGRAQQPVLDLDWALGEQLLVVGHPLREVRLERLDDFGVDVVVALATHRHRAGERSEEHTSELQSLTNLVCRLLLEKKKKKKKKKRSKMI